MKKTLLKIFYNLGGFAPFHLAAREKILILTYHRFSRAADASKISADEFAAHLAYLKKYNQVLSLNELTSALSEGKSLPPNAAAITIDDGYADAFEIAFPILKQFDLPATLFAVTDFLDRKCWLWTDLMRFVLSETKETRISVEFENGECVPTDLTDDWQRLKTAARLNSQLKKLPDEEKSEKIKSIAADLNVEIPALPIGEFAPVSWEQAREMDANNLSVESHTVTHPILTNINQEMLDFELGESKKRLQAKLNREVEHFCYPNGSLNEQVKKSVENAGYKSAVTTAYGFNEKSANRFALNRIDASAAIENFAQSASGFEALRATS